MRPRSSKLALLAAALVVFQACAPLDLKIKQAATASTEVAVAGLNAAQQAELVLYNSQTIPALTPEVHRGLNVQFIAAWDALIPWTAAVRRVVPGHPETYVDPALLAVAVEKIAAVKAALDTVAPGSSASAKLADVLGRLRGSPPKVEAHAPAGGIQ